MFPKVVTPHSEAASHLKALCVYCQSSVQVLAHDVCRVNPRIPVTVPCPACCRANLLEVSADGRHVTLVVADLYALADLLHRSLGGQTP